MGAAFDAEDSEFRRFVQKLLDGGHIENETSVEIARHILDEQGPLNIQQTWHFAREVVQPFSAECLECKEPFPWSEAYDMIGKHQRCDLCEARYRRFMD